VIELNENPDRARQTGANSNPPRGVSLNQILTNGARQDLTAPDPTLLATFLTPNSTALSRTWLVSNSDYFNEDDHDDKMERNMAYPAGSAEQTSGLYYKQVTIVMTLACIIKLETIVIDDAS
jgi:hypothetical protein